MGLWVSPEFMGFVAWVCRLGSLVRGFVDWVCLVWFLLGFVFVFVWVCRCFYFVPCSWIFFQRGAKEEEEERLAFWLFHVEIECLKFEFQVNFR